MGGSLVYDSCVSSVKLFSMLTLFFKIKYWQIYQFFSEIWFLRKFPDFRKFCWMFLVFRKFQNISGKVDHTESHLCSLREVCIFQATVWFESVFHHPLSFPFTPFSPPSLPPSILPSLHLTMSPLSQSCPPRPSHDLFIPTSFLPSSLPSSLSISIPSFFLPLSLSLHVPGLSLSRSVLVGSNRHSVKLSGTHRNFRPCQPALEWQIHLSIPQNSYKMPLLQLNSVLRIKFL